MYLATEKFQARCFCTNLLYVYSKISFITMGWEIRRISVALIYNTAVHSNTNFYGTSTPDLKDGIFQFFGRGREV